MTQHFAWFALCVLLGVGVTIAVTTHLRTHSYVKVSPFATVDDATPVTGFCVAETSEAVYFGSPVPMWPRDRDSDELRFDERKVTLVRVPKAGLIGLTIGPLLGQEDAYKRSLQLALAICERLPPKVVAVKSTGTKAGEGKAVVRRSRQPSTGCRRTEVRDLRQRLAQVEADA